MSKKDDLKFLEEMLMRLEKAPYDPTQYEYLKKMITDWIDELMKK
ncbi:MAG: hypothetical protein CSYNP_02810 [Syntrophus sp. SKADARSKE-3]|nr:hypothetical protein [Syntrophus sp. SKADARSKE-3]